MNPTAPPRTAYAPPALRRVAIRTGFARMASGGAVDANTGCTLHMHDTISSTAGVDCCEDRS